MTLVEPKVTMENDNPHPAKAGIAPNESLMPDSDNGSSEYFIDPVKERRMMRKFDV